MHIHIYKLQTWEGSTFGLGLVIGDCCCCCCGGGLLELAVGILGVVVGSVVAVVVVVAVAVCSRGVIKGREEGSCIKNKLSSSKYSCANSLVRCLVTRYFHTPSCISGLGTFSSSRTISVFLVSASSSSFLTSTK